LIALVLAAILPAFVITIYQAEQLRQVASGNAEDNVRIITETMTAQLARVPADVRLLLEVASQMPQLAASDETQCGAALSRLKETLFTLAPLANLSVADLNGNVSCTTLSGPFNVSDRSYFQQAIAARQFSVAPYVISKITDQPVIVFAQPMLSSSGSVTGALLASVELDRLAIPFTSKLPEGTLLTIFAQDGTILVRSSDQARWVGKQLPDENLVKAALALSRFGIANVRGLEGTLRIYGISSIEIGSNRLFVSSGFAQSQVFARADAELARGLLLLAFGGFIALGAAWTLGDRFIVRAIRELIQNTGQLASGNLAVQIPIRGTDELSELASSFNSMSNELKQQRQLNEQARVALQTSEIKFRSFLAASPDVTIVVDQAGLIEFVSNRTEAMFGYPSNELVGKPLSVLVPERYRGVHAGHLGAFMNDPRPRIMGGGLELRALRKDGSEFSTEISLSPDRTADGLVVIAAIRDNTDRKNIETQLRFFIKYSPAAIAMLDNDMRYLAVSDRWLHDYGLVGRNLEGLSHYEVFPEILDHWRLAHRRALTGETLRAEEDKFERPNGDVQWLRWELRPWQDTGGRIGGIVIFSEDITERKRTEAQFRQAQKMEAIGQLTGGIAHDFNNLLTIILGNSEILADELKEDPQRRELAETVITAAERGASLTQLMLAFARRQPLEPQTFALNELVTQIGVLLQRTIGENIEIKLELTEPLWNVTTDPRQMETALLNLVLNARDAMPQGGRLTIETSNANLSEEYAAHNIGINPGRYVVLVLSDTGSGIPPEFLEQVFEPFFTTKEVGKGTGLGLSMVYGFVKQSGGNVKIYSEVGHGTTIRIYLPRAEVEAQPKIPAMRSSEPIVAGVESILVVEDDPDVRTFAVQQLRRMGYTVSEAADGPSALRKIAESGSIDLLFTDVIMPGGMTGRQLSDRVKETHPEIKVLFTSGYTENSIVHHGRLDPGVQLLQKPYRLDQLARKVREVLDS
jgi:PAS domain S-box-containing protein